MNNRKKRNDDNKKLTKALSTKLSIEDYNRFAIYTKAAHIAGIIDEPKPSRFLRYIATVLFEGLLDKIGSTLTTIGSLERNGNGNNDNNGNSNNRNDNDNNDDEDKKLYAFQIESDGGQSADPESVDGKVFAGEKNIERNNWRDFDIKDVFNDCQVSMFND